MVLKKIEETMNNEEVVDKEVEVVEPAAEVEASIPDEANDEVLKEGVEPAVDKVKDEVLKDEAVKDEVKQRNMRLLAKSRDKLKGDNLRLMAEKKELEDKIKAREEEYSLDDEDDEEDAVMTPREKRLVKKQKELELSQIEDRKKHDRLQNDINKRIIEDVGKQVTEKYIDFADVVSQTNVSTLEVVDEELYKELLKEPDLYTLSIKTYEAIRKHGIYTKALEAKANKEAITKNLEKPKSAISAPRKNSDSSSVFSDLHSKDYQNKLRLELAKATERL